MDINLYSIYDKVATVFNKPFSQINDESAKRAFRQSLQANPEPQDYELYFVGSLDDDTGNFNVSETGPKKVMTGFEVLKGREVNVEEVPQMLKQQNI